MVWVQIVAFAQTAEISGKVVYSGPDVVFHQIDEHTWVGTGHLLYNESMYLVEGNKKAMLIDTGKKIADLDKIVLYNKETGYGICHSWPFQIMWQCWFFFRFLH